MKAETMQLQQGAPEWHAHRVRHYNASEAAAMLGISPYKTRAALLREKATGITPGVDAATQARFDRGHAIEALARPLAEVLIGEELFPVVLAAEVDGLPLSASLDGLTMGEDTAWECKTVNAELSASLADGIIPMQYWPQMEQGLLLSGAERCLFTASDGTDPMHAWYESKPELRRQIIAGWKQFAADLAAYRPEDDVIPAPAVAASHEGLPAVTIQAFGAIDIRDNLVAFGDALTAYLGRLPKSPETDDDFATLEDACKRLKAAEDALDAAENGALAQASSIDDMRRQVERWRSLARDNRLAFEKLVRTEKENRKAALVTAAREALSQHIAALNQSVGGCMPSVAGDWAGVIKGLKTMSSIKDALDGELTRVKIAVNQIAETIRQNRLLLIADGQDWTYLFPDFRLVCEKAPDDFGRLLRDRIAEHTAREAARQAALAEHTARDAARQAAVAGQARQQEEAAKPEQPRTEQDNQADREQPVVLAQDDIRAFLDTLDVSTRKRNELRAVLVEFVKFQAAHKIK